MADAAQNFLDKQLSKNRFTSNQQARLDTSGGPSVAGSGERIVPGGSAYDKYRPTSEPKLSEAEAYLDRYKDLQYWDSDSGEDGLHTGEGKWSKEIGRSSEGMEKGWVGEMNKMYGTEHTDMNQFSKEQYAKAHWELHGKKEGRTWGNTDTPEVKPDPTPIEQSPEVKQATERVRSYEDNIMSGKTSSDIFGDTYGKTGLELTSSSKQDQIDKDAGLMQRINDKYQIDLNAGASGIGTANSGAQAEAPAKAADSFLSAQKSTIKKDYNFKPSYTYGQN